jgi:hypothetical protein
MTSPQVYEEVHNPFTALNFVDFVSGSLGVLYIHDGAQGMLRDGNVVRNLLTMYDAWDEDYFVAGLDARMRILPHRELTHSERWRHAQEFNRPPLVTVKPHAGGDIPPRFEGVACSAPGVVATAFYREAEGAGRDCLNYAGGGMQFPYVLRLVELNGNAAEVSLRLGGRVAAARLANLRGECMAELEVLEQEAPGGICDCVSLPLQPHAIATVYLDLEMGRKVYRDLDSRRHVWAGGESHERRLIA